ncbi:hypothetical protein M8C21_001588 [Ambrosia artemisiifolia]|uniref:Disease resistance protein n=1 Tax=Ambrosia artemisiifolia TaxID=4212 RepID=A0AAD5C0H8_AMBAR|nr:hypothetical protein M8C21_001588 [Ambrosia artemisiifolia]
MDNLQSTLKSLTIDGCDNMDESWLLNNNNNNNIESIPDNGYGFLPFLFLRHLKIKYCKNLKSFPHEQLQNLTSLKEMRIRNCQSLDFPFPGGSWPPNLSLLEIGELKKPVSEWGMQKFPTSLVTLILYGGDSDGLVSFAAAKGEEVEDISSSFILPSSLTELCIWGFKELESVSEGMQHLTCLQLLMIMECPKVRDLPETLLPSLSSLTLFDCSPELKEKCSESRKGKYWPLISQIPRHRKKPSTFTGQGFLMELLVVWSCKSGDLMSYLTKLGALENFDGSVVELANRANTVILNSLNELSSSALRVLVLHTRRNPQNLKHSMVMKTIQLISFSGLTDHRSENGSFKVYIHRELMKYWSKDDRLMWKWTLMSSAEKMEYVVEEEKAKGYY